MTQEEFNIVFELQMRKCADILAHKKKEYTGDNIDRLSAFKIAAALQNCDPKAALAGMMSKHVVSLYDMCYSTLLHFDIVYCDWFYSFDSDFVGRGGSHRRCFHLAHFLDDYFPADGSD